MSLGVVAFIVFMERAQRRILVQYPKAAGRQPDVRRRGFALAAEDQYLGRDPADLRIITAVAAGDDLDLRAERTELWLARYDNRLSRPRPACLYDPLCRVDRVFFCFFYTAIVFNPQETADNLRKYGGFVPGIRPGKNTADYLDYVLTRLTVVGAAYLSAVCILPEILISQYSVPFYFGGTSLLIVVSVTMDTVAQIHSHLLAHQYEGLIKKARLRGRRG
jgi:preprotein translocase subunit SecY